MLGTLRRPIEIKYRGGASNPTLLLTGGLRTPIRIFSVDLIYLRYLGNCNYQTLTFSFLKTS